MRTFLRLRPLTRILASTAILIIGITSLVHAVPNFTKQNLVLISSATPQDVDASTSPLRAYFLRDNQVLSSTSTDGVTWSEESGVRLSTNTLPTLSISSITACSLLTLTGGGYRMLYSVQDSTGAWSIVSATSSDGLSWGNDIDTQISVGTSTFVGSPKLVKLPSGNWRVFYVQDINGGNDAVDKQVVTSVSADEGDTWSTGSIAVSEQVGEIGVFVRTDLRIRLYMTQPLSGETTNSTLISAISADSNGTSFFDEIDVRLSTESATGSISFPVVFRSTDTFRHRIMYAYTMEGSTIPHVFTGLTTAPDPTLLTPNEINRTDPNPAITISGEIFGSTPTVLLRRAGESDIVGTGVTWGSDLSVLATFATNSQTLGSWDLVMTNPDGVSTTLTNAFLITFQSGQISLVDNLLRLSSGGSTQIAVTVYENGNLKILLYTLDGKLINRLYDGDVTIGTTNFSWNGRTAEGNPVASGTYLIKVDGPKLDNLQKIVVIR